jgi:hypothetical protein
MAGRNAYTLFLVAAIASASGAARGQGMQTFRSEEAAQHHCPADRVVWLNTSSSNYHLKGDSWYGHTERGAYVCKAEADKDGVRAWANPR